MGADNGRVGREACGPRDGRQGGMRRWAAVVLAVVLLVMDVPVATTPADVLPGAGAPGNAGAPADAGAPANAGGATAAPFPTPTAEPPAASVPPVVHADELAERWAGGLFIGGEWTPVEMHLTLVGGQLAGILVLPYGDNAANPLEGILYTPPVVNLTVTTEMGLLVFDGTLSRSRFSGTVLQDALAGTFTLFPVIPMDNEAYRTFAGGGLGGADASRV